MADRGRQAMRRRARRRRMTVVVVALAVVAAGAGTAWAMTGSGGPVYRLATAERADVEQTVDADGTLAASDRATLAFPTSGTVASVPVAVGDHVTAGQAVARLDPAALESAVTSAKQQVAQARQRLAADEDAQANGTTSTAGTSSATRGTDSVHAVRLASAQRPLPTGGTSSPGASGTSRPSGRQGIEADQHAVEDAQQRLDAALADLASDLHSATTDCADGGLKDPATSTGTVSGDEVSGPAQGAQLVLLFDASTNSVLSASPDAQGRYTFSGDQITNGDHYTLVFIGTDTSTCTADLNHASRNQADVKVAEADLKSALTALNGAVTQLQSTGANGSANGNRSAQNGSGHGSAQNGSGNRSAQPGAGTSPRTGTGTGTGTGNNVPSSAGATVTAEQIAADTKTVDAAQAALAVAQHDVGYATLTTPISGTVGSLSIKPGDSVSASSTSATVVVVGTGALSTQVDIGLSDIDLVKVGQAAQVTVDGRSTPLAASVTYVGAENASSGTGSTASYPVTVTLRSADARLFDGMGAGVAIDVGAARGALTVPVSAVHTTGRLHTVVTYADGKARTQRVTLGVQGQQRVQVLSGLSAGDRVVLADVGAAVPSSGGDTGGRNALTRLTGGGFGGLGGGGFVRRGGR